MKLFPILGGIHPEYRKELTSEKPIVALPIPAVLYLPLQQHMGAPATTTVEPGDLVKKGQLLARGAGAISAPVHAPTSGKIVAITELTAPHPSGLPTLTIILETDGKDEWAELPAAIDDPFAVTPQVIRDRVAQSGIVGMGGATFPSAVKLGLGTAHKLEILLLNGAECEPYLTCDDRIMREHADAVVDGARIMAHALGAPKIIIAIEDNKPQAIEATTKAAASFDNVSVAPVPVQYPMGAERHLTQAITGRETPARKLTADVGVVVHNVATAKAVHDAVRLGRPLLSRVVTVSGGAVAEPKNIQVPLGTRVTELLAFCGGATNAKRYVSGGPMMGQPLPSLEVPVVKGTSGILALTQSETKEAEPQPCIRCGSCVTYCPCGLVPVEMASFIRHEKLEEAAKIGVQDCVSCGSCSYICPSNIPLVHFFNYAKGRIAALDRERRKTEQTKALVEAHNARLERLAQAKKEAAAKAKAAKEAEAAQAEASGASA
ncbi:electron transport complex subunit RsxC [Paramagnetospirillum kuznetsovii]|uniref:Ion-translocating oxidoreductase complex subunit C n=1 Tax=Paramagnetospirillum kuznetsovii TaxID=2053833 RepID=A0A364NXE9_9PROT|nr:electron transport complex subunit RsxC [Paramagnetospirillum kuznetsovii]RAU21575.1 electron transport complex subunit RsxC [Paramagnetospirillum kuznetsovii]